MKLLLVEDDRCTSELTKEILTEHNYVVEVTTNGATASHMVESRNYDLAIIDVILPGIDGISLCHNLRSSGCYIPILVWSAQDNPEVQKAGLDAGADDYLVKPCKIETLLKHISTLLKRNCIKFKSNEVDDWLHRDRLQVA